MITIHIDQASDLQAYIDAGMRYSALKPDLRQAMQLRAIRDWYLPLLKDGYSALPSGLVLDLGVRTLHQGPAYVFANPDAPNDRLFARYVQALDVCYRDTALRDLMSDIALHRQNAGVVLLLKKLLTSVLSDAPVLAVVEQVVWQEFSPANITTTSGKDCLEGVERMIHHVSENILHRAGADGAAGGLLSSVDRRLIQAVTRQESAMAYPDLELIDRCMQMDDLPPLKSAAYNTLMRTLHTIRLEQPLSRHVKPDGGFVGIRNNGGLEDLSNPVISEWANPSALLWDKLTNRNLLIYERSARTLYVHHMVIHMMWLDSSDLLEITPGATYTPLQSIKYLMAAVARDLALYASQISSVEVQLNLQQVESSNTPFDVRRVSLTGLTEDAVKSPQHFLLDERDVFPWFFSTDMKDTPAWIYQQVQKQDMAVDLMEDLLPERDIQLDVHINGFENAHCFVFCSADQYTAWRTILVDHARHLLDLNPSGLDSLVFVFPDEEPDAWRLDMVHEVHRNADNGVTTRTASEAMSSAQVRDVIRHCFLARLLGAQFRSMQI